MSEVLNILIANFLKERQAKEYALEGVSISQSLKLKPNEVIFIYDYKQTNFSYLSLDEYFNEQNEGKRISQNLDFIEILSGLPVLVGLKVTITDYWENSDRPTVKLLTDKQGFIQTIQI